MTGEWSHHIGWRCRTMDVHHDNSRTPVPCPNCYSVEIISRPIPWTPQHPRRRGGSGFDAYSIPLADAGYTVESRGPRESDLGALAGE